MNGLLVIDKPSGMTSRDVVNRVQRWFPRRTKIGHTGTLDPLATGVLVICIGAATRLAVYVQAMGKTYHSRFRLGAISTTDDADGAITEAPNTMQPLREQIEEALTSFIGNIEQVPPEISALKVNGQRAHNLARKGQEVPLAARPVLINAIRITGYEWPFLDMQVDCGKGTYIRSIARDLGAKLGCGGLVQSLRRTKVGPFTAEQGIGLDADPASVKLLPMTAAIDGLKKVRVNPDEARKLRRGQPLRTEMIGEGEVAILDETGELIGLGADQRQQIRPTIIFPEKK